jgi:predicted DNA-binding transcriptional regulator AlpA
MSDYTQSIPQELEPLISIKQARELGYLPISPSNFYSGVSNGKYPKPVKIGKRNFYTPSQLRKIRIGAESQPENEPKE